MIPFLAAALLLPALLQGGVQKNQDPAWEPANDTTARLLITQDQINQRADSWLSKYKGIVTKSSIGKTREGRDIPIYKIDTRSAKNVEHKEAMLLAGIHPREQQPSRDLLRFMDELLAGYQRDERITDILDRQIIWVVPSFNVDGKLHDVTERDWRKNRSTNADGSRGVDLNRNFSIRWGGGRLFDKTWKTTTTTANNNIFEGTAPLSEPESKALANFFESRPNLVAFLDIHNPLREILFPPYATIADGQRMHKTAIQMQRAQQGEPYKVTKPLFGQEPPADERSGNSGLTYHHAYYLFGIHGFNFEISNPAKKTGLSGRYPSASDADKEYTTHVRGAWLEWLDSVHSYPLTRRGDARVNGSATTTSRPKSGSTFGWIPPTISGSAEWAVITSDDPRLQCISEIRRAPFQNPFTIRLSDGIRPGTRIDIKLTVWGQNRSRTVISIPLVTE